MNQSNKEKFIEKAKLIHAGENLDYSEVEYTNNRTPVKIIDRDLDENGKEYGEFWQTPSNHLKGQKHPRKRGKQISESKRFSTDEVISMFKKVHQNENLDYSQVKYVNMHTKVKIISHDLDENGNEYGEFWQEPCVHLKGCTHPKIGLRKQGNAQRYTTDIFIEKCKSIYGNERYSFDAVDYKNSKTKVNIFCNKIGANGEPHGYFLAYPDLFLQGKGCPKCGHQLSNNENEIYDFICNLVGKENVVHRDTSVLGDGKELDIYVPKYNFAVEYDGLRWHSEEFGKGKYYHYNKTIECNNKGITLYHVFEDEYLSNKSLVLDKIQHTLGLNNKTKIGARKCIVSSITKIAAADFLTKNHIQGFAAATHYIGAVYEGEIVGVMTFKKISDGLFELNRFATNVNYNCQGLAQKLFKYFIKNNDVNNIKTFLDARWLNVGKSNIYDILGFKKTKWCKPDYQYTLGQGKRFHKFQFRKQRLHKKYGLPLSMTESEMVKELGYHKIWNCGLIKYEWNR